MTLPDNFVNMLKSFMTFVSSLCRMVGLNDIADEIDRRVADEDGILD